MRKPPRRLSAASSSTITSNVKGVKVAPPKSTASKVGAAMSVHLQCMMHPVHLFLAMLHNGCVLVHRVLCKRRAGASLLERSQSVCRNEVRQGKWLYICMLRVLSVQTSWGGTAWLPASWEASLPTTWLLSADDSPRFALAVSAGKGWCCCYLTLIQS